MVRQLRKKQDNRAGSAFIPHEAAGDYELPSTRPQRRVDLDARRTVGRCCASRSAEATGSRDGDPVHRQCRPAFDNVTHALVGAYVNSVGTGDRRPAGSCSSRWQYDGSYTYFMPSSLGGDHEFKVGG